LTFSDVLANCGHSSKEPDRLQKSFKYLRRGHVNNCHPA